MCLLNLEDNFNFYGQNSISYANEHLLSFKTNFKQMILLLQNFYNKTIKLSKTMPKY